MEVKIINKSGLSDPCYATEFSSGMDLCSSSLDDIVIEPMQRLVVKTGIFLEIPEGYEAQIRPRSGMSLKYGITCVNSPGTIDADYRGEIGVILINLSKDAYTIKRGDRIAQMVFTPFTKVKFIHAEELSETVRGEGGYGSTGKNDTNENINLSNSSHGTTIRKFTIPTDVIVTEKVKESLRELIVNYDGKEFDETKDYFIPVSRIDTLTDFNKDILVDEESGTVIINYNDELPTIDFRNVVFL